MLYFTVNHRPAIVRYLEGIERPETPGQSLDLAMKRPPFEDSLIAEFEGSASLELIHDEYPLFWTKVCDSS